MESTYYYCKCSICFENDSEMELINCGDQYCLACLERYVEYWIREGSWGLLPVELTCPVCAEEMETEDWMPYVSEHILRVWQAFQQKRALTLQTHCVTRACPACGHLQPLTGDADAPLAQMVDDIHACGSRLAGSLDFYPLGQFKLDNWRAVFCLESALDLLHDATTVEYDGVELLEEGEELFNDYLRLLQRLQESGFLQTGMPSLVHLCIDFARLFLRILDRAMDACGDGLNGRLRLISLQLNYQLAFPFARCDQCRGEFCLPCLRPDWFDHPAIHRSTHVTAAGLKQCPRCLVVVDKDPEGCNEMHCNYCGMRFCWECGRRWSITCGVYKCANKETPASDHGDAVSSESLYSDALEEELLLNGGDMSEDGDHGDSDTDMDGDFNLIHIPSASSRRPEIGVPNVHELEARYLRK